jgi:hypothetical protein
VANRRNRLICHCRRTSLWAASAGVSDSSRSANNKSALQLAASLTVGNGTSLAAGFALGFMLLTTRFQLFFEVVA